MSESEYVLTTLLEATPPFMPDPANVRVARVDLPPGDPGAPPHWHPGPDFGYVVEGELRLEIEGQPERIVRAGEAFWEPGGDTIHYRSANNLADGWTRFVVINTGPPHEELFTPADPAELEARRHRRHPGPA
jgi:quercetin dioxygenase-like cupin family protein